MSATRGSSSQRRIVMGSCAMACTGSEESILVGLEKYMRTGQPIGPAKLPMVGKHGGASTVYLLGDNRGFGRIWMDLVYPHEGLPSTSQPTNDFKGQSLPQKRSPTQICPEPRCQLTGNARRSLRLHFREHLAGDRCCGVSTEPSMLSEQAREAEQP